MASPLTPHSMKFSASNRENSLNSYELTKQMGQLRHELFLENFELGKVSEKAANHIRDVVNRFASRPAQGFSNKVPVVPKQTQEHPRY